MKLLVTKKCNLSNSSAAPECKLQREAPGVHTQISVWMFGSCVKLSRILNLLWIGWKFLWKCWLSCPVCLGHHNDNKKKINSHNGPRLCDFHFLNWKMNLFHFLRLAPKSYPTTKNTNEHIPVLLLKFTALLCKFSYNVLLTKNKQNKSHVPLRGVPSFLFVHSGVPSIIKDSSLNQKVWPQKADVSYVS